MGKSMFARGYEASRAEKERQDKARENMGKRLWRFFLKDDGDEADLRFLTEEPVNFAEHNLKRGDNKFEQYTCTGDGCPFCADGDRPTYKGAYLVVDHREFEYKDENGKKKKGKDQVRLFVQGMKVVSQLDRISEKYGLSNRDVTIIRLGNGTQTTYTFEKGDEEKLTTKEVRNLLPEKLRDSYKGTVSSLMDIIEEQLMMATKDYEPDSDGENEEYSEEEETGRGRLISMEDEEEEQRPARRLTAGGSAKKPTKLQASGGKKLFRKPQNSMKPRARTIMQNSRASDGFMNIPDGIDEELPFN